MAFEAVSGQLAHSSRALGSVLLAVYRGLVQNDCPNRKAARKTTLDPLTGSHWSLSAASDAHQRQRLMDVGFRSVKAIAPHHRPFQVGGCFGFR